jgi:hypothetical protein
MISKSFEEHLARSLLVDVEGREFGRTQAAAISKFGADTGAVGFRWCS